MQLYLSIPERLTILKALQIKTGLIDTILLNYLKAKVEFTPEEIDYAGLADGTNGTVTYDQAKPIIVIVPLSVSEINLLNNRFGNTAEYQTLKSKLTTG